MQALVAERQRMSRELAQIPYLQPYPSQSNFILCRVLGRDAGRLKRNLEQAGILVRYFNKPKLDNCIRISAGRPEETDRLLAALRRLKVED
ncbi:MAG: aminotransferase class I/II-fold pyridoxal phosphate-dependent enzyme [Chloroflexi bacterium]|nr:aminotransferase class I/II-fold pyridoxal phosphate-dependent enzyme [Chloroflexota bacterium]